MILVVSPLFLSTYLLLLVPGHLPKIAIIKLFYWLRREIVNINKLYAAMQGVIVVAGQAICVAATSTKKRWRLRCCLSVIDTYRTNVMIYPTSLVSVEEKCDKCRLADADVGC